MYLSQCQGPEYKYNYRNVQKRLRQEQKWKKQQRQEETYQVYSRKEHTGCLVEDQKAVVSEATLPQNDDAEENCFGDTVEKKDVSREESISRLVEDQKAVVSEATLPQNDDVKENCFGDTVGKKDVSFNQGPVSPRKVKTEEVTVVIDSSMLGFQARLDGKRFTLLNKCDEYIDEKKDVAGIQAPSSHVQPETEKAAEIIQTCMRGFLARLGAKLLFLQRDLERAEENRKASLRDVEEQKQQRMREIPCTQKMIDTSMRHVTLLMKQNRMVKRDITVYKKESKQVMKSIKHLRRLNPRFVVELTRAETAVQNEKHAQAKLRLMIDTSKDDLRKTREKMEKVEEMCRVEKRIHQAFLGGISSICDAISRRSSDEGLLKQVDSHKMLIMPCGMESIPNMTTPMTA